MYHIWILESKRSADFELIALYEWNIELNDILTYHLGDVNKGTFWAAQRHG